MFSCWVFSALPGFLSFLGPRRFRLLAKLGSPRSALFDDIEESSISDDTEETELTVES